MNIRLLTIGILLLILIILFVFKVKKKKQIQQKEHQKIREYGERLNNKTSNSKSINRHGVLLQDLLLIINA